MTPDEINSWADGNSQTPAVPTTTLPPTPQAVVPEAPLPPTTEAAPPPSPTSSRKKLVLVIGLVLVLLLLAVGIFIASKTFSTECNDCVGDTRGLATPTPTSETANSSAMVDWVTYTNSKYNYSLKYPLAWSIKEEEGSFDSQLVAGSKVSTETISNGESVLQVFFEGEFDHGLDPWELEKSEEILLGGKNAKKTTLALEGDSNNWIIVTIENFHSFRIEIQTPKDQTETIDQILSTFEFTDTQDSFACPETNGINCKPPVDSANYMCSEEYISWAETNCPNFTGAAY